jgi:hypothetical protein
MAVLNESEAEIEDTRKTGFRVRHVGTKLSVEELRDFEGVVEQRETTQGELIRDLILAEIAKPTPPQKADPLLTEIVGVRLLLVNLLGPIASGQPPLTAAGLESVLDQIKRVKHQVALDIQRQK